MLQLIPAIDIIGGQCVRLTKGDYDSKTVYDLRPLDFAKEIEALGYRRLHMVDLDGARSSHVVNIEVLNELATHTNLQIDFGGGIKTDADLEAVFENGATFATIGSVAAKEPQLMDRWIARYGADRLILGADVKDGFVCISGWKEKSRQRLMPFLQSYYAKGIRQVLCTDISKDGMLQGPAVELYKEIMQQLPHLHIIASGGVSCEEDIARLDSAGIPAVVFGKAIYEGKIDLKQLISKISNQ